jgi:3-phosphoshikimate 1-carboxyvinyltransferase
LSANRLANLKEVKLSYLAPPLDGVNPDPFIANIPGSKSLTNRALILAAQRLGTTRLVRALHCEDTDYLATCLDQFGGISVNKTRDGYRVERTAPVLQAPNQELFVGGAGTPARFLLSFAAMARGETTISGNPRLYERPMGDLLRTFDRIGIRYECPQGRDHLPIRVLGSPIAGKVWTVAGTTSSQFTSSLLLLAAQQQNPITVLVEGKLVSRPYVDMTIQMLQRSGIQVRSDGPQTFVVEPAVPRCDLVHIEADASGMSYFLAAAALTRSHIVIPHIGGESAQGDVGFARILSQMGAEVSFKHDLIELQGHTLLRGIDVDMDHMPDTVLTLAAVAATAHGSTHVFNIANLRLKECDRIAAAAAELQRLEVPVVEGSDCITICPTGNVGRAKIKTYNDHRVAMSFAILGLRYPGIEIQDPKCVAKSFPTFWAELNRFRQHHGSKPPADRSDDVIQTESVV